MNKEKLKEITIVAACGLMGGLLAWLMGIAAIAASQRLSALLAALLGGAIAAGVGVYLVANTDTTQVPRLVFFACLCGLSWQAVLATGNNLVQKAIVRSDVNSVKDASKSLAETRQQPSDEKIKDVANTAVKIVDKLPGIESPNLKSDARATVVDAIKTLRTAVPSNPKAAEALGEIAKRADESGSTPVKQRAVAELKEIANAPQVPEEARKTAAASLEQIDVAARNR